MLKKLLPTNGYKRKLARVIVLADGTELVTLRDAANVLLDVLGSDNARSGLPNKAVAIARGKDGQAPDIAAATDAVKRALAVAGRIL